MGKNSESITWALRFGVGLFNGEQIWNCLCLRLFLF